MLQKFKQNWKGIAIVFIVVTLAFFAVMGDHFADVAVKPFWYKLWATMGIVSLVALVIAWVYAWITQPTKKS